MSEISTSPPATRIPLVAPEEGAKGRGRPGQRATTRHPELGPDRRPSHSVFQSPGDPSSPSSRRPPSREQGPEPSRGDAPRAPSPGRLLPLPTASAPGAQVWPGHQVQSALAPGRLPSRAPSLWSGHPAYLRVQLGHRHGRESLGSSSTAMGRLGVWACDSEARGREL